jgi:hypothetical protein
MVGLVLAAELFRATAMAGTSAVEVKEDNFEPSITFVGPAEQLGERFLGVQGTNLGNLRCWLDKKTGAVAHQFYVTESHYGSWDFPYAAYGENGKALRFVSIAQQVIGCHSITGCAVTEIFGTNIEDADLRLYRNGFSVKFKNVTRPVAPNATRRSSIG